MFTKEDPNERVTKATSQECIKIDYKVDFVSLGEMMEKCIRA